MKIQMTLFIFSIIPKKSHFMIISYLIKTFYIIHNRQFKEYFNETSKRYLYYNV